MYMRHPILTHNVSSTKEPIRMTSKPTKTTNNNNKQQQQQQQTTKNNNNKQQQQ